MGDPKPLHVLLYKALDSQLGHATLFSKGGFKGAVKLPSCSVIGSLYRTAENKYWKCSFQVAKFINILGSAYERLLCAEK